MLMPLFSAFHEESSNWKLLNHTGQSVNVIFRLIVFAVVQYAYFVQYLEYYVKLSLVV